MTTKEKPATDDNREAGNGDAFIYTNSNAIRRKAKALIVNLAVRNLIPTDLATWLIQRGWLRHE